MGPSNHAIAANDSECVRQFLAAGGAVNGHDFGAAYEQLIVSLVSSAALPVAILDRAVTDVLRVKARLGLIGPSPAVVDTARVASFLGDNSSHVGVALRAARESIVLLTNVGGTLPLNTAHLHNVLVLGPNGDAIRSGDYSAAGWAGGSPNGGGNINNANAVTVVQALKSLLPSAVVTWAPAAQLTCAVLNASTSALNAPLWSTIQQHSVSLASPFVPTAPSVPYKNSTPSDPYAAGTPGLQATYTSSDNATVLVRLDAAPNFHFLAVGPE